MLTTYGRSSGFCVDPIEKKPLNHFLPGIAVLSFGTAGCNLACRFCQNWDISQVPRDRHASPTPPRPEAIAAAAQALGCRSVAFTYNDPVIFLEYAIDVRRRLPRRGLQDGGRHRRLHLPRAAARSSTRTWTPPTSTSRASPRPSTGASAAASWAPVLDTLEYLRHETSVWLEITTLLIPGENDSDAELDALTALGGRAPRPRRARCTSPRSIPDFRMLDVPRTPPATLTRARRIALAKGVRYAYTGNVRDRAGGTHHVPRLRTSGRGARRLRDHGYHLSDEGRCLWCGTRCPGVFRGPPGTWGGRRLPVRMAAAAGR